MTAETKAPTWTTCESSAVPALPKGPKPTLQAFVHQCEFPLEAGVDRGYVRIFVKVDADGRPTSTAIACESPMGQGFAAAARACAARMSFEPVRNEAGQPQPSTAQFNIHFAR